MALHGHSRKSGNTRTYRVWSNMKTRCLNPRASNYRWYGARGIAVCDRWRVFANFLADMGECPNGMTLDRINGDGPYEPTNCRWATQKAQSRNTRGNRLVTYRGETRCVAAWAELLGLSPTLLYQHLDRDGWTPERALGYGR